MNFSVCLVIFQNILNNNHGLITTYGKMKLFSRMPLGGCVERKSGAEKEKCLMKFHLGIKKQRGDMQVSQPQWRVVWTGCLCLGFFQVLKAGTEKLECFVHVSFYGA